MRKPWRNLLLIYTLYWSSSYTLLIYTCTKHNSDCVDQTSFFGKSMNFSNLLLWRGNAFILSLLFRRDLYENGFDGSNSLSRHKPCLASSLLSKSTLWNWPTLIQPHHCLLVFESNSPTGLYPPAFRIKIFCSRVRSRKKKYLWHPSHFPMMYNTLIHFLRSSRQNA